MSVSDGAEGVRGAGGDSEASEDRVSQSAKFQEWQSVECAWCDRKATGNALHVYDGQWFASCGKHGRKFETFGSGS